MIEKKNVPAVWKRPGKGHPVYWMSVGKRENSVVVETGSEMVCPEPSAWILIPSFHVKDSRTHLC